jgi:hypothetical protein
MGFPTLNSRTTSAVFSLYIPDLALGSNSHVSFDAEDDTLE